MTRMTPAFVESPVHLSVDRTCDHELSVDRMCDHEERSPWDFITAQGDRGFSGVTGSLII